MKSIEYVRPFLLLINATIKPKDGCRHNLTINEKGELELTLMLDEKYQPVLITYDDLIRKDYVDLADEITDLILQV